MEHPTTISGKHERSVYRIVQSSNANMGRMNIRNVIQGNYQDYVSPFFIMDEFGPMQLSRGMPFRVDAHPHAGIIPTTYLFEGNAHHRDSMGNDFQYDQGDQLFEQGGTFHGIQSWLNIPGRLKQSSPYASHIKQEDIPVAEIGDAKIRVILGEVPGVKSNTSLLMPVIYWHVTQKENSTVELPVDPTQNAFVYLLSGPLELQGGRLADPGQAVLYERDGDLIKVKASKAADYLVMGGEVNIEPFAANGPFVLNNERELQQAYIDFQHGLFGDADKTNGVRRQ